MREAFTSGNLASLSNINNRGWLASESANVFVVNHDRERGGNLNYKSPNNIYTLAMVYSLSYPYGSPTILSSYEFSNNDAGAPNGGYGECSGEGGSKGWLCQHRWHAVSGMVGFNNAVRGSGMDNWVQGAQDQIAFGRVKKGFVAINGNSGVWTREFTTSLPNGSYCDVISGKLENGNCTGPK
ncbi:hypothetical protein FRC03_001789 [Tulasnella sp. 419]|nr:hypothetical protein FRC03_001789 [Tulasnella sp. 419]